MVPWSCFALVLSLGLGLILSLNDKLSPFSSSAELKRKFAYEISGTLRRSESFRNAFTGLYLDAAAAAAYAREIRQAAGYFPLFGSSEEVDEAVAEDVLQLLLSPSCCGDVGFVADGVAAVFADFAVCRGYVGTDVGEMQLQAYAGGFAGGVIWRLARLPRTTDPLFRLQNATETFKDLADSLSARVRNSKLLSDLCRLPGIDDQTALVLSRAVCGSLYLNFDLGLAENVSRTMVSTCDAAMAAMPPHTRLDTRMLIVSSVVGQTLAAYIVREGGVPAGDLEEVSFDVYRLVSLGITLEKLNIEYSLSDTTN